MAFATLNIVWAFATCLGTVSAVKSTNSEKGLKIIKNNKVPITLNKTWAAAVLFGAYISPHTSY